MEEDEKTELSPFTIEQFYKFLSEKKIMAAQCKGCGAKFLPPRPICSNCYSKDLKWIQLKPYGKLITYTIIHVAPKRFQQLAPYAYGIIELEDGLRLPGMIKDVKHDEIKIGMELKVFFEPVVSEDWPNWPAYYFKPSES
ncbi:Zn-ribbon domain-containing OB-fold protein [Candidatus Bathyarchaeota archaeon]|nr:MAG: Zn-ribbon domain-containing OB-fold protein [Candidatus Bathyarchaeota archaeon]